jgi:hypothetical protein
VRHLKLPAKQKDLNFLKIAPLEALVDNERWKMSMLKGMYAARMPTLIQSIWLKGSRLTYVVKKLMILVAFVEIGMHINWACIMFNKFQSKLWALGSPHKSNISRDVEFGGAQILDILFWKWFLVDLSFQVLDSEEEDELEENLPIEVWKRNLPPSLGV